MTDRDARPVRKKIRLDPEAYAAPGTTISVTIATAGRRPVFADPSCTQRCLDVLQKISSDNEINIIVYCFMPDHLHLLLENTRGTDIPGFMRQFKSWTTRIAWQHDWHGALWQRSYHDHVLREYEDTSSYIRYILGNPVQADLVQTWNEYPWSGSFIYDFSNPADWPT